MTQYLVYDECGRIVQHGSVPDSMFAIQKTGGRRVLEGTGNWDTHYVSNDTLVDRPENPASMEGEWLVNLPNPCTIHINEKFYPCEDDHAELTFAYPGRYIVRVESFPYLDKTIEVIKP